MNNLQLQTKDTYHTKLDYYSNLTYTSTRKFFKRLRELHKIGGMYSKIAGQLFEDYNWIALPQHHDNIVKIWDTNDVKNVPHNVITEIFGKLTNKQIEGIFQKGSSYGLDKIVLYIDGTYGLVSDKSILSNTLSSDKPSGLLTLATLNLQNVTSYILCTNASTLPWRFKKIFGGKLVYVMEQNYVPNEDNELKIQKDKLLWKTINLTKAAERHGKIVIIPRNFKLDGQHQIDWTSKNIKYAEYHIDQTGKVRHWAEGSMGLGKSMLDPFQSATIEKDKWCKELTNTEVPINVTVFDKCSNAVQNGERLIDIKKQILGENRKTLWVTNANDAIDKNDNIPQVQSMDVSNIVFEIIKCINLKIPIEIITLQCVGHLNTIRKIEHDLKKHFEGFKFWEITFDECDLIAVDMGSALEGWFDFDPIRWYGSTGTPTTTIPSVITQYNNNGTNNKNIDHNLMDNTKKWGICSAVFGFQDAMDAHLVPPLQEVWVGVKLSEIKNTLLKGIQRQPGLPLLKTPIKNFKSVRFDGKDIIPNVEFIARMWGILKTLSQDPGMFLGKRCLGFTNFLVQAKLVDANWKWMINQIEGQTTIGKKLANLWIELMQEKDYKDDAINPATNKRKRLTAWNKSESLILVQKLFGRGTDMQFDTGFHFIIKTFKAMIQEICRLTRLNRSKLWDDQWRYYIMVIIKNDIDPTNPTYDQKMMDKLRGVLHFHKSARDELELMWRNGQGGIGKTKNRKSFKAHNIDPKDLDAIVKTIARTDPNGFIIASGVERLHNDMLKAILSLPNPNNTSDINETVKTFLNHPQYLIIKSLAKSKDPLYYLKSIWRGRPAICRHNSVIRINVQKWKIHKSLFETARQNKMGLLLPAIKNYYKENPFHTPIVPTKEIFAYIEQLANKLNLKVSQKKRFGNAIGEIVRGTQGWLSEKDKVQQQLWYKQQCNSLQKHYQDIIDYASKNYKWPNDNSYVMTALGADKKIARVLLAHPLIDTASNDGHSSHFNNLNYTAYHQKVEDQIKLWKKIAKTVWSLYINFSNKLPHKNPRYGNSSYQIKEKIKKLYGVDITKKQIAQLCGILQKRVSDKKNIYTTADHFTDEKVLINWHKSHIINRIKLLKQIKQFYDNHKTYGKAINTIKKFKHLNLKDDFLKDLNKSIKSAEEELAFSKKNNWKKKLKARPGGGGGFHMKRRKTPKPAKPKSTHGNARTSHRKGKKRIATSTGGYKYI